MSTPAHTALFAVFDENGMTSLAHPSYSPDLALNSFCFVLVSLDEKSPQREMFCRCAGSETKNSRSTKRHQQVQKPFWNGVWSSGKVLIGVLHQMESTLKVTKV